VKHACLGRVEVPQRLARVRVHSFEGLRIIAKKEQSAAVVIVPPQNAPNPPEEIATPVCRIRAVASRIFCLLSPGLCRGSR